MYFSKQFEELEEELEMLRELTLNRCQELEILRTKYQNTLNSLSELEKNVSIFRKTKTRRKLFY